MLRQLRNSATPDMFVRSNSTHGTSLVKNSNAFATN